MRLKGKTAFICGASRNNGRTIANTFAREGADLILVAREQRDKLDKVAKDCEALGAKVLPVLGDMGNPEEANRAVRQALDKFSKIDILMTVAGIRLSRAPWDFTYEEWHRVFAINLHAVFYLAKAIAPGMMERGKGGSIIALTGNAALTADSGDSAAQAASRHGLHGLVKALAQALGPHGIRANLLTISNIESEGRTPEWYANAAKRTKDFPLRRMGKQQDVANAALFLASDESSYITGDRLVCEGGLYM